MKGYQSMRTFFVASVLLIATSPCFGQTDLQFEGSSGPAIYNAGYVLEWEWPGYDRVFIHSPDTKLAYSKPISETEQRFYSAWAIDSDGVGARANTMGGKQGGEIQLLDRAGNLLRTIVTGSYYPQHVVFGPDHTLWTIGYEDDYESRAEDFKTIHHYGRHGEEIGSFVPWQEIAGDYNAYTSLSHSVGGKQLYAANDRIGFRTYFHTSGLSWIEIGLDGHLIAQYDLGDFSGLLYEPLAMTAEGKVYARIYNERQFAGWAVLDRSSGKWRTLTRYPRGTIIGTENENVIFSERNGDVRVLRSISSESLRVEAKGRKTASSSARMTAPHGTD
jgi:hypothetical protein